MKKHMASVVLCGVALCAGLLLGTTNALTKNVIAARALQESDAARRAVLPYADAFVEMPLEAGAPVADCYEAQSGGACAGFVCTAQAQGYGGVIEVIVGMGADGRIAGVSVGGGKFAETVGLGAKTKEPAFTDQFLGALAPLTIKEDIDAVTGATISSTAVVHAVNTAAEYAANRLREKEEAR